MSKGVITQEVTDLQGPYRARTLTVERRRAARRLPVGRGRCLLRRRGRHASPSPSTSAPASPARQATSTSPSPSRCARGWSARPDRAPAGDRPAPAGSRCCRSTARPSRPATPNERTESCVDAQGVILSETWTVVQHAHPHPHLRLRAPPRALTSLYGGKRPSPLPTDAVGRGRQALEAAAELAALLGIPVPPAPLGLKPDRASGGPRRQHRPGGLHPRGGGAHLGRADRLVVLRVERDLEAGGRHGSPAASGSTSGRSARAGSSRCSPVCGSPSSPAGSG